MSENNNLYYYFLKDLTDILKEKLIESNNEVKASLKEPDILFNKGKLIGYYDVITLIKTQAISFNIDLSEIGLFDFKIEKYLD
jgi:hypothetical protein